MDLRRIDLNLLATLEALHVEGTVTGAARRLKVSQPTISMALARLRDYFGDTLFVRTAEGMRPTPFTLELRAPVQQILAIVEREIIPRPRFSAADTDRTFTITTSDIGELCFLPDLLRAFTQEAPRAKLRCLSLPLEAIASAMNAGDLDAALGYFPDLRSADIARHPLFHHPFVCLARAGHPLVRDGRFVGDFLSARHAVVRAKGRSQELIEKRFGELGLRPTVYLESPHFMSLPFLIAESDLVAIVPRAVAASFADVTNLQAAEPPFAIPPAELALHWPRRWESDQASSWLITLLRTLFDDRDPTRRH